MKTDLYLYSENHGNDWSEVPADELGHAILTHDGFEYEIRESDDFGWTLWHSRNSASSQLGGTFIEKWEFSSEAANEHDAQNDILRQVASSVHHADFDEEIIEFHPNIRGDNFWVKRKGGES